MLKRPACENDPAAASDHKARLRRAFSRAADTYDDYVDVQRAAAARLAERLPLQAERVLEIGCGTGLFTQLLRRRYRRARITALDFSPQMIDAARAKFGFDPQLDWQVADIETWQPPSRFDLIAANSTLQWLDHLPHTLARLQAELDPPGTLAATLFGPQTYAELQSICGTDAVAAGGFPSADSLQALFTRHFPATELEEHTFTRRFDSLLDLLRSIKHTGTGGSPGRLWTPRRLQRLEGCYREQFGEIVATYQVFVIVAAR